LTELRRIAMLLHTLDESAADAVLSRLPDDVRTSVEEALRQHCDVRPPECEAVARDFLGGMRAVRRRSTTNAAVGNPPPSNSENASFESLVEDASITALAELVRDEHPQICAVVIGSLSAGRAAALLQAIAPERRADALRRVLGFEDADAAAVAQIRQALASRLGDRMRQEERDSKRLRRVQAIFVAAHPEVRNDLIEVVEKNAVPLSKGKRGGEPSCTFDRDEKYEDAVQTSVSFDRLVDCDDDVLRDLFSAIPLDVCAVALAGASQPVRQHILDRLPDAASAALQQRFRSAHPVRVADIHIAQAIVLRILERSVTSPTPMNSRMTLSA
jgi:flagellar motor switch protein FliG